MEKRLVTLILLFAVITFLVHRGSVPNETEKERSLATVFGTIPGYELTSQSPLPNDIYRFLDLDDYTSTTYEKNGVPIGLYIGYYFSLDKASAAHSPLVCFPGQGWTINQPTKRKLNINGYVIHYAEISAQLASREELILYWYQAGDTTSPEIYRNKINGIMNKLSGKSQEHAFVRVSIPFAPGTKDGARMMGEEFIKTFYPSFLSYVANRKATTPP